MNVYIIEVSQECWAIGQVVASTHTPTTAWQALGPAEPGCILEAGASWIACRILNIKPSHDAARQAARAILGDQPALESRRHNQDDDEVVDTALGLLFANGKARFERGRGNHEIWFAT